MFSSIFDIILNWNPILNFDPPPLLFKYKSYQDRLCRFRSHSFYLLEYLLKAITASIIDVGVTSRRREQNNLQPFPPFHPRNRTPAFFAELMLMFPLFPVPLCLLLGKFPFSRHHSNSLMIPDCSREGYFPICTHTHTHTCEAAFSV